MSKEELSHALFIVTLPSIVDKTKALELLNELIDKVPHYEELEERDTPMKQNMENMHYICCPNCNSDEIELYDYDHNVVKLKYCNNCGQGLDWSEDER